MGLMTTRRTLISAYLLKLYLWAQNWPPLPSFMESSSRPQEVTVQLCGLEEPGAAAGSEICLEEFQTADLV
jgi:hypothetical protein